MTITTQSNIWLYRELLPIVHEGNLVIESEAGNDAARLIVSWGLVETKGKAALSVSIIDTGSPQLPLAILGVSDLQSLRQAFRDWHNSPTKS